MKCVCGYKHEWYNYETDELESNGTKKFIKLKNHNIEIENQNWDGWHGSYEVEVDIYACPKCGTLKIDV